MIIIFKKIFKFILLLLPWFISSLFMMENNYYKTLNRPFFAPPGWLFPIVWSILFILITISVYKVINKSNKEYLTALITNYIFNQLFVIVFFVLENNFLGFVDSLAVFISSLFLYNETKQINKKASIYLIPYLIWNIFATILSLTIFFMNN